MATTRSTIRSKARGRGADAARAPSGAVRATAGSTLVDAEREIAAVRQFNRFYTQKIGVLRDPLLQSAFSLTEARVLYELAQQRSEPPANAVKPTATELAARLELDEGYLSRILRAFEKGGLLRRERDPTDGRQRLLRMTRAGRRAFAPLDRRSHDEIAALLAAVPSTLHARLVDAMRTIEILLAPATALQAGDAALVLREPRPGDLGWIVHRHGVIYAREYGYDRRFEALVADIAAKFVDNFDAGRERCWIAERGGRVVGSVFVVRESATKAKLRLLLVEPEARGLGLGKRLVDECIRFARDAGYRKLVLWTQSELAAARGVYVDAGFRCVRSESHRSFGRDLTAETWELAL